MRNGRASRTAEHNALFRALEQRRPGDERLFEDPYVAAFLSPVFRAVVALARFRLGRSFAVAVIDRGWPGVRPTVVARTRLIDELVEKLVADVEQVVILGAGFDTRAYRLAGLRDRPVYEVDHPDTQRRKLAQLPVRPDNVAFVPTDFTVGGLGAALEDAGYRPTGPTLFLWEGVTNYLTDDAVDRTLRWIAAAAAGSHLVMTYVDRRLLTHPEEFHGSARLRTTLRRTGEPMTFGIAPAELADYLAAHGLELANDTGAPEFRKRHFPDTRGHEFYRVAHARVAS